jgi:hypothetical protein
VYSKVNIALPDRDWIVVVGGEQMEGVIMAGEKKKSVEDLIGHALSDKSFRDRLLASPEATLSAEGYEATPEVIQAIKSANLDDLSAFESNTADRKAAA